MRGFSLTVFFCVLLSISQAQSLRVMNSSNNVFGKIGSDIEAHVSIKNVTLKPIEIIIQRTVNNISNGEESYFCLGKNCFFPSTDISTGSKTIRPGEIYDGFKSILRAGVGKSNSQITYCFINAADAKDKICTTINYQVEPLESNGLLFFNDDISVSNIYPNPINELALFDFSVKNPSIKPKIILHNVLGSVVGEYALNEYDNKLKIYTQSFNPGVYFYTLSIDNQNLITKKFVIKR